MASQPVIIKRQGDGRHAVIDAQGQVLGLHNSVWSAARQIHEYNQPPTPTDGSPEEEAAEPTSEAVAEGDVHPPVPRPSIPRPAKDPGKPAPISGKRIPRP